MEKRPHIIIFNPDEMRYDGMGHMGNPAAVTPFLDRFAKEEAVSFRYAFCQNPVCVPSRCSFFTGLYPHAIACLNAGFHVLTEKPIAIHLGDADLMTEAAKRNHKQLGVIFQNRYIEGIREVKRLIEAGEFGRLTGAFSTLNWWRPPSYYDCDWKGSWEREGGGVVIDQAIHSLDLVRYLMVRIGSGLRKADNG